MNLVMKDSKISQNPTTALILWSLKTRKRKIIVYGGSSYVFSSGQDVQPRQLYQNTDTDNKTAATGTQRATECRQVRRVSGKILHPNVVEHYHLWGFPGMLLSPRANHVEGKGYSCCPTCKNSMTPRYRDKKAPRFSIENGIAIGDFLSCSMSMTMVKYKTLIRRYTWTKLCELCSHPLEHTVLS